MLADIYKIHVCITVYQAESPRKLEQEILRAYSTVYGSLPNSIQVGVQLHQSIKIPSDIRPLPQLTMESNIMRYCNGRLTVEYLNFKSLVE